MEKEMGKEVYTIMEKYKLLNGKMMFLYQLYELAFNVNDFTYENCLKFK
jgi:hypothetical protein